MTLAGLARRGPAKEEEMSEPAEFDVLPCWVSKGDVFDGWGWHLTEYPEEGVSGPFDSESEATADAEKVCSQR